MSKTKIPKEEYPSIKARYEAGESDEQIGATYGVTKFAVKKIRNTNGWTSERAAHNAPCKVPESAYDSIRERYEAGETDAEIAKTFNCDRSTIALIRQKIGVKARSKWSRNPLSDGLQKFSEEQIDEIVEEYESGETVHTLGRKYGVAPSTISKALNAREVEMRHARTKQKPPRCEGEKWCTDCGESLPLDQFHDCPNGYLKKAPECKNCKFYRDAKRMYGLSREQYDAMSKAQNNCCLTCGAQYTQTLGDRLCVDHCHKTGKVRGLLCVSCNLSIGFARDARERFRNFDKYIEQNE